MLYMTSNVIHDIFLLLYVLHVSLIQNLHREALVEAADHSTNPDQEACPHHGLILLLDPADKSELSLIGYLKLWTTKNPSARQLRSVSQA